ncbi:MAG: CapA family protein [bacterium]|nr:CapA family protein [bacterium]
MERLVLFTAAITVYSILFAGSLMFWHGKFQASLVPLDPEGDAITLLFAGDIMLDRGVEFYIRQHNDWRWPFLRIADTLQKADLVFGNLESVISNKGQNLGSIYSFRADPKAIEGLMFAGFDVVSVANNHSLDYGPEAFLDSLARLKEAEIAYVGGGADKERVYSPVIKEVRGTKIGFLGYTNLGSPLWQATENTPGIAWVDEGTLPKFQEGIRAAKQQSDILVVSVHFGEEYQTQPNKTQVLIAKSAIDAGADIVIGHHPHVVQPVEQYKNGWITWSLGNLVFDQGFSPETMRGLLLEVTVKEKQITQVVPRVIRLNSFFQPELK